MAPISTPGRAEPVHGIEMYYETRGEGEPLVLLHGGGGIGANWDLIFKVPPQGYQLIIPDLRGRQDAPSRGHSAARPGRGHGAGERNSVFSRAGARHHAPVDR